MGKINKIKVNGTPYEVEDKEAVKTVTLTQAEYDALQTKDPSIFYVISDGQGGGGGMTSGEVQTMIDSSISGKADSSGVTQEISAATSGKVDTSTFETYSGTVETALSGKVDTSAITSSITSASTDSQVPSAKAVYGVATTDEYPIEGVLSAKHFWDDENMGAYTEIGSLNNIKVPNSNLLSNPYISYVFAENEEFMGDTCALVATVTSGSIASVELLNGSSVSSVTATYDNDYIYFTTSASSFSADGLNIVAVMGNDFKPSNVMDLRMNITESAVDCGVISVVGNIPSEYTKDSVKRIYDTLSNFEDVNPIAGLMTLKDPENGSTSKVGYGVLNYNTYNPLTDSVKSGSTNIIKYNALDFKSESNVLSFNKTVINKERLKSVMPQFTINQFSGGSTSTHTGQLMNGDGCMIIETNANATQTSNISISISTSENQSGSIEIRPPMGGDGLEVSFVFNNVGVNKTESTFVKGDSIMLDLRKDFNEIGDWTVTQTFTVDNWQNSDLVTAIIFYGINDNMVIPIADVAQSVADGKYATNAIMLDELSHKPSNTDVNIYEYGNPSAVTVTTSSLHGTFYGFSVSGVSSGVSVQWYISDGQESRPYSMTNGVINNNNDSTFVHCINKELTNYENGVVNVFLNTSDAYISMIYASSQPYQGTVYQSITVTPIKDALSEKQDILSAGTGIDITDNTISVTGGSGGGKAVSGGTNISITTGETADTINCTLPISRGSGNNNSLILGTGNGNTASGQYSISVGGRNNSSSKYCSLVGGNENQVSNEYETAFGNSNVTNYASTTFGNSGNTLFSVGNGSNYNFRHNAFEIRQDGSIYIPDLSNGTNYRDRPMIKLQDALGGGGSSYTAGDGIDITNDVISVTGKVDTTAFTAHTADTVIHVTSTEKAAWNAKSDFSGNYNDLSNKPTIPSKTSDLTNDSNFATTGDVQTATNDMATKTWVGQQGYLTQHQDISGKQDVSGMTAYTTTATTSALNNVVTAHTANTSIHVSAEQIAAWDAKSDFSGSYNDLTNKLSAGTNVTIVDNVISAEGGGGKAIEAGRGISITTGETADTVSFSLPISAGTGAGSLIIGDNGYTSYASVANGLGAVAFPGRPFYGGNRADGESSFAHGTECSASTASHAEGSRTKCTSTYNSHSEGADTEVRGMNSHSEGEYTLAGTYYTTVGCHAEGFRTSAMTNYSHAEGSYTKTTNVTEHASGQYNNSVSASTTFGDSGNTLFSVGNGTANNARHNAFEIRQNGDIYISKDGQDVKLQDQLGGSGGGKAVSGGTNISITTGETADTINCTLPITATSSKVSLTLFGNSQEIPNPYSVNFGYNNNFGTNPTWIYNYGIYNSTPMYGNKYYVNFGEHNSLEGYGFEYTFGEYLKSVNQYEFAFGKYNKSNKGSTNADKTLFSVGNGNGTSSSNRHNAFEIRQNGDIYITSGSTDIKLQDHLGGGGASYSAGTGIDITNNVISVSGVVETSAITTSVTSSSTDAQVPSAKAVYDIVGNIETLLSQI